MNKVHKEIDAYVMNPPYNGSDRANKPWVSIVINTICNAQAGAEFLFIVPIHWRTHPGTKYTKVLSCLRTNLEFFEEHEVDPTTFGVGEEISWWIARKKRKKDNKELHTYTYWDNNGDSHQRTLVLHDGHPYHSVWKEAYDIIFNKVRRRYNSRGVSQTFKKLNQKNRTWYPKFVQRPIDTRSIIPAKKKVRGSPNNLSVTSMIPK